MHPRILVVDDSPDVRQHLKTFLEQGGASVETAGDVRAALDLARTRPFHLLITDFRMPDMSGLELLNIVKGERMTFGIIMITGHGDTALAVEAMKAGADDFVTKPFEPERFRILVGRILERRRLINELEGLRHQLREEYSFHNVVSKSPKMRNIFELVQHVGPLGSAVLIQGETGTGKELVAQAIHAADKRRGPWRAINCAAMVDSLLESELFGHERGAFTGADRQKPGLFELAQGGTLFLDEIGDISPAMQAKLPRVLQTGEFERVGGTTTQRVDVRIIAASNKRLENEVQSGRFRRDLFYRLNVIRIDLPPLRERPEDIPLLAAHFLERLEAKSTPPVTEIDHEAMQALVDYRWPGNVRELENAIKAAVAMADGPIIHAEALPSAISGRQSRPESAEPLIEIDRPLPEVTEALVRHVEREYLAQLLARYRGNVARCARHAGLSRRSVTQKLLRHGLDRTLFKLGRADTDVNAQEDAD
jgi:DNA-binding NtrC family response regulator